MSSIIDAFNANLSLSFSLLSTKETSEHNKEYAFEKSSKYFETATSPYFWQISFSQSVNVESYIIGGDSSWKYSLTSWDISFSNDEKEPSFLQTDSISSLIGKSQKFQLKDKIVCKHFRITARSCTNGVWLAFNQFDLFGTFVPNLKRKRKG